MTINLHIPTKIEHLRPTITVIGVGGAGGNAVNNMIASNLEGVNFVVANTDAQALDHSLTERTIQLGAGITKGLGAGANPNVGREAAEEARDEIAAYIEGSNMVFITAGMGGGTGTGAASVVARIAKDQGILTVAVVTKPFQFEGKHRMCLAEDGLKELQEYVDTLIVIPNQNLFRIANERTTFADAFKMADEVLHSGVRGVTDLMVKPGHINLDFSDIRTVMREMGKAIMGTGEATGDRKAIEAAELAISNPLLDDVSLKGARALLINVTGGHDMTLFEVDEALNRVREEVDPDANIIFGSTFSDNMEGKMRVSVVATGIDTQPQSAAVSKIASSMETRKPYSFGSGLKPEPIKASPRVAVAPIENVRDHIADFSAVASRPQFEPRPAARFERASEEQATGEIAEPSQQNFTAPTATVAPIAQAAPEPQAPQQPAAAADVNPVLRESTAPAHVPQQVQETRRIHSQQPVRPVSTASAQRENIDVAASARGFFKRMADAGRALSTRGDEEQEVHEPRVQVVQKSPQPTNSDRTSRTQDSDQYLDIPAFLRRQAN
jgi:cell division protein FtsZ